MFFQACLKVKSIPPSWKKAKIILIPKQGKKFPLPQSYRPISLLNNEYTILKSKLAFSLNSMWWSYIDQNQIGLY